MFVEIAGTKQMAAAGFHVISFHLPCRLSGRRGQEDNHTEREKAYLLPASHIHLLLPFKRILRRGVTYFDEREDFTAVYDVSPGRIRWQLHTSPVRIDFDGLGTGAILRVQAQ
jgi:hypothetical protein